jgi:hypothetical protein
MKNGAAHWLLPLRARANKLAATTFSSWGVFVNNAAVAFSNIETVIRFSAN